MTVPRTVIVFIKAKSCIRFAFVCIRLEEQLVSFSTHYLTVSESGELKSD